MPHVEGFDFLSRPIDVALEVLEGFLRNFTLVLGGI
jgi:hypothetical protein